MWSKNETIWIDLGEDHRAMFSAVGVQRQRGEWYPVQIDQTGTAWRLGRRKFSDPQDAQEYVSQVIFDGDPGGLLMQRAAPCDAADLGAGFLACVFLSIACLFAPGSPSFYLTPLTMVTYLVATAINQPSYPEGNDDDPTS